MSRVFCWGSSQHGQLGIGASGQNIVKLPYEISHLRGKKITDIGCGETHSLIGLNTGEIYSCGSNEYGQLGHRKGTSRPEQIDALKAMHVVQTCVGKDYSLALTSAGEVFSWGSNQQGQLGRGPIEPELCMVPKLIKQLVPFHVVQIAAGAEHCLALANDGQIFCWGSNSYGQLGLGNNTGVKEKPHIITSLRGIPIKQISTGASHSFILSVSGALFGWGKNSFGQLGLNDEEDRYHPTLCKSLRQQNVKYVSCGADHTVVLTKDGGVFTFGAGSYGQLGHDSTQNEILPKKVVELMGSNVSQIACGRRHSLVYIDSVGKIYSFGLGGCGQLGLGNTSSQISPSVVQSNFIPNKNAMQVDGEDECYVVEKLFAGGDHCFVTGFKPESSLKPADYREFRPETQIALLVPEIIEKICRLSLKEAPPLDFTDDITRIFSSASCLNSSFLLSGDDHYGCTPHHHDIDMDALRKQMDKLCQAPNIIIIQKICQSLEDHLLPRLPSSPPDVEAMRLYLILPHFHLFDQPKYYSSLIGPFGQSIIKLGKSASKVLDYWWGSLKPTFFSRIVYIYQQCITYLLQLPDSALPKEHESRKLVLYISMEILKKLNAVNETNGQKILYHKFYVAEIQEKIDLRSDYIRWVQKNRFTDLRLSFCDYPFLFDAAAKSVLLSTDALMQMQTAIEEVQRRNIMGIFMPIDPVSPCLVLHISRDNIVSDTIRELVLHGNQDFKKPLKVKFQGEEALDGGGVRKVIFLGEEAVDEGGVKKEFFLLLLREVLDPKYGMFKNYEESNLLWFLPQPFEDSSMYHLIGCLCGLAIYNTTIIQLDFPLALYKKLLKIEPTLDDLKELIPTVGRSLEYLLNYADDDIDETFGLTFQISDELYGEVKTVELSPGGKDKLVTKENRKEYVNLYVQYTFTKSVEEQFTAFSQGFHKVCGGRVLELFHPQELKALVVGNENYDFLELEKNTDYKGEYHRYHPTIKIFWEVFHEMSMEEKKKYLLYLTGCDRIPIFGMKSIKMVIQPVKVSEDYLPAAHTCFNLLDLPMYTSKPKLKEKLLQAIDQTEGFGLV